MKNKCEPKDYYETPPDLFEELNREFDFDLDACANHSNCKVSMYLGEEQDALSLDWNTYGSRIFCNPPYSKAGQKDAFIAKAAEAASKGSTVVMVIPAKVNTKAFHKYIYNKPNVEVRYPEGRPVFWLNGKKAPSSGRNEIMIVVFRPKEGA